MLIDLVPWIYNEVDNHIKLNKENEQSLICKYIIKQNFMKNRLFSTRINIKQFWIIELKKKKQKNKTFYRNNNKKYKINMIN